MTLEEREIEMQMQLERQARLVRERLRIMGGLGLPAQR